MSPEQMENLGPKGLSHFPVDQLVEHDTAQRHEFSQLQLEDAKQKIAESQSQLAQARADVSTYRKNIDDLNDLKEMSEDGQLEELDKQTVTRLSVA